MSGREEIPYYEESGWHTNPGGPPRIKKKKTLANTGDPFGKREPPSELGGGREESKPKKSRSDGSSEYQPERIHLDALVSGKIGQIGSFAEELDRVSKVSKVWWTPKETRLRFSPAREETGPLGELGLPVPLDPH